MNHFSRCRGKASEKKPSKSQFFNYLFSGFFAFFALAALPASSQVTNETFESGTPGQSSFTSNGQLFNVTQATVTNLHDAGYNGQTSNADQQFLQSTGQSIQISRNQSAGFQVVGFYLLPLATGGVTTGSTTCTLTGTLGGVTKFSQVATVSTGALQNGYAFIDMTNINSNNYSHTTIDALNISFAGATKNVAFFRLDYFGWTPQPTATVSFSSNNVNPAYAKTGDAVSVSLISTSGNLFSVTGSLGSHSLFFLYINGNQANWGAATTFNSSTPQGPIGYDFIITDETGDTNELVSNGSTTGLVIFDNINPVFSTSQPSVTGTNSSTPLTYSATWTDTNLDPATASYSTSDVQINKTGSAVVGNVAVDNSVSGVSTITLSNITGDGTVGITLPSKTGKDYAGNSTTGSFTSNTTLIDNTPPTATISAPSVDSVGNDGTASVIYSITYADANFNTSNLTPPGITLNSTGNATGTVSVTGSGLNYTVTISNISGAGQLGISLAAGYASDLAGNTDPGAGPSANFIVASTTAEIGRTALIRTNQTSLSYLLTFPVPVTGLTASNFSVTSSFPNAAISDIIPVPGSSNTQYGIEISSDSSPIDGIDSLTLVNDIGLSVRLSGLPVGGSAYHILLSPFTATVTGASNNSGNSNGYIKGGTRVSVGISSNRPIRNINGSIGGTSANASLPTNQINNTLAQATLTANQPSLPVLYSLTVQDQFGNLQTLTGSTGYTYDSVNPTQVVSAITPSPVTSGGIVNFGVQFNDAHLDVSSISLTADDIDVETNGTVTVGPVTVSGSGNTRVVQLTQVQGVGSVSIGSRGTASDLAGNGIRNEAQSSAVTINFTPPQCSISEPSVTSVSGNGTGSVSYTVTYSSDTFSSSNLTAGGITLNATGTATGTVGVSGSGDTYTVSITNITGAGTLGIAVAGGFALDQAGNSDFGAGPSSPLNVLSSDATLASLSLSSGTLSPTFSPGGTSYTATVPYSANSITVTAIPTDAGASIATTVNGSPASGSAPLSVGPNTISVVVTAADGTTKTYTVTATRGQSINSYLAAINPSVGHVSPAFTQTNTAYTLSVSNATASITVKPVSTDAGATLKVNGSTITSGTVSDPINLAEGTQTPVNIVVRAANGSTRTYTLTVTRAPSADAELSSILTGTSTLKPAFVPVTISYTNVVPNVTTSTTITPIAEDANAMITVNGTPTALGSPATINNLVVGTNTVTIAVTAQDGSTKKTYTVTVTRALSANDNLGTLGSSISGLNPAFVQETTSYTLNVRAATSSMTIKPVTSQPNAIMTINGAPATSGVTFPITLAVGSNTIAVKVTAQDGVTNKTYTVIVTRPPNGADSYGPGISVTKPVETPALAEDGILVHQGLSPNGDGINDFLQIDNIGQYPDNKITIMNRNGQLVYEAKGYDNSSKVFDGHSNKNGAMQLPGTYFYQLDYTVNGTAKHKTGFLVLKY